MSTEQSKSVRMMIQSGLIPKEALQQMENWRLLPEGSVELAGTREVTIEKGWDTVSEFVEDLNEVLSLEDRSIKETSLDKSGGFKKADLVFADHSLDGEEDVFVDMLGRLVLPPEQKYQELMSVTLKMSNGGPPVVQQVVNMETRYEGNYVSAFVIYLDAQEIA